MHTLLGRLIFCAHLDYPYAMPFLSLTPTLESKLQNVAQVSPLAQNIRNRCSVIVLRVRHTCMKGLASKCVRWCKSVSAA